MLDCSWLISAQYKVGEPVLITQVIRNTSNKPIVILRWHTLFEKPISPLFEVRLNNQAVAQKASLQHYGTPLSDDYLSLEAFQSVTAEVDLARLYDLTQPGLYTLLPKQPIQTQGQGSLNLPAFKLQLAQ